MQFQQVYVSLARRDDDIFLACGAWGIPVKNRISKSRQHRYVGVGMELCGGIPPSGLDLRHFKKNYVPGACIMQKPVYLHFVFIQRIPLGLMSIKSAQNKIFSAEFIPGLILTFVDYSRVLDNAILHIRCADSVELQNIDKLCGISAFEKSYFLV